MSRHDEFKDLEKRLRQARPSTEPLPPAWKRDLRAQLMEKATMNQEKFNPGRLFAAAGALILLVAIPLFFWIGQSSLNQNQPMSAGTPVETETPTAATEETTAVSEATATVPSTATPFPFAWIVSVDPAPGTTLAPQDIVNVTVGYDLQSVVAEAQLLVKLVTGEYEGVGVGMGKTAVSQNRGTATISIPLENLEVLTDGDEVHLQLILANNDDERLLYLDMPEDMSWSVSTTYAEAAIVSLGEPRLFQPPGDTPSEITFYEVDISTEYTLAGYENAVLVINAEHQVPGAGSSVTSNSLTIQEGSSTSTSTMIFAEEYFDENGVLLPDTTISVMINMFDEETSTYTNLYPGNIELPPGLAIAPPPASPDMLNINAVTVAEDGLNVSLKYHLESSPTATLKLQETSTATFLDTAAVSAGEDITTLSIPADLMPINTPLTITASLDTGNQQTSDSITLHRSDFENNTPEDLWIAHVEVITDTIVPAYNALLHITFGYHLNETFSDGQIRYSIRSLSNNANGGGGGGGGGQPIPTGLGVVTIPLYVPLPEDDADVSISLQFELTGTAVTDTGTETQSLSTLTPTLDELLSEN